MDGKVKTDCFQRAYNKKENTIMKTTRKSFSRKSILVIVSIFLAISLTATGFAAWLISNDAGGNKDGNVNVSDVSDAILGVTVNDIKDTVKFAPQADDKTGNIRVDESTEETKKDVEKLEFNVTGNINKFQTLATMEVTVKCADTILKAAGYTWTGADGARVYTYDKTLAFISLPTYAMDKDGKALPLATDTSKTTEAKVYQATDKDTFTDYVEGTNVTSSAFTFKVSFGWGALFEGYNPGRYLDEETIADKKLTVSAENKTSLLAIANKNVGNDLTDDKPGYTHTELDAFAKRDLLDYMYDLVANETAAKPATATYTVVINAKAK